MIDRWKETKKKKSKIPDVRQSDDALNFHSDNDDEMVGRALFFIVKFFFPKNKKIYLKNKYKNLLHYQHFQKKKYSNDHIRFTCLCANSMLVVVVVTCVSTFHQTNTNTYKNIRIFFSNFSSLKTIQIDSILLKWSKLNAILYYVI